MGIMYRNDCVNCPDGCHGCGRNKDYKVYYCDNCGYEIDDDEALYKYKNNELCITCLINELEKDGVIKDEVFYYR